MKTILWATLTLIIGGCAQQASYTISGTVENPKLEGKTVYLRTGSWISDSELCDSALVQNGKYLFKGVTDAPCSAHIFINPGERGNMATALFALENAHLNIHTDAEGWSVVSGSPDNDTYQQFADKRHRLEQNLREVLLDSAYLAASQAGTVTPEQEQKANQALETYRTSLKKLLFESVKEHINNPAFWNEVYGCSNYLSLDKLKELLHGADARTEQHPDVQAIRARIAMLERTAIGQPFIDLQMVSPTGDKVALSDYIGKGKYVMLDFWNAGCGPCRKEFPFIKNLYAKYKDKGLEIVGISFDSKKESWLKALEELQLPWPQMSDLKGWDSEGASSYGIAALPHNVLFDKEGRIIDRNLHGEDLEKKLAELFGTR